MKKLTNEMAIRLDGMTIHNFTNVYEVSTSTYKKNGEKITIEMTVDGYRTDSNNPEELEWDEEISCTVHVGDDISDYAEYEWAQYI